MRPSDLVRRSLTHYWRTHLAVVLGVAVAVTVLSGALLVGDSVRGSLRDLVLGRIGRADLVVTSAGFFRDALARDIEADPRFEAGFRDVIPLIVADGVAVDQATSRRASRVQVYGVDDRFWQFHGLTDVSGLDARDVLLSPALARELGTEPDGTVLVRVQKPSAIPLESLHGRKDDVGQTLRLTMRRVLPADSLGEFSLTPTQGDVRAAFVPLARLQRDLDVRDRANTLLVARTTPEAGTAAAFEAILDERAALEDLGLRLRILERQGRVSVESEGGVIDDALADRAAKAATAAGLRPEPIMTYLVNTIRLGSREVPYSLVTGLDLQVIAPDVRAEETDRPPIVLNEWAARDLGARPNDTITLEYFVWVDPGRLVEQTADFQVAAIVPLSGAADDRQLAPDYPGITESLTLSDWDPPFPIDLKRVRDVDEEYWKDHRTTPKAFVPVPAGRALWRSRYGSVTSIRLASSDGTALEAARDRFAGQLRESIDPTTLGLMIRDVRGSGLTASRGATDFGEYFTYFSFFLVVSAITLAALFFKLGVEQRVREVGLLRAVGAGPAAVRSLFFKEAVVLASIGSLLGLVGALAFGELMMLGLRTWWVDAVGTTAIALHVSPLSLLLGLAGGVGAALACIWWTLRGLADVPERALLAGQTAANLDESGTSRRRLWPPSRVAAVFGLLGVVLAAAGAAGWVAPAGAFFGAGGSLLVACLAAAAAWLRRTPRTPIAGHGLWPATRLGLRNATYRPGRTVLSMSVVATAAFILVSVDAFRRTGTESTTNRHSGTGGYSLLVDLVLPLVDDPSGPDGLEQLGLTGEPDVRITPLRVLPGDDASCLNLYQPQRPRIVGVSQQFISEGRFRFQGSLHRSEEERANPWLLLNRELRDAPDDTPATPLVPVIADANSMTYVLHRSLGEEILIDQDGRPIRLRLVAALADSVLQGELVMSEEHFKALFPHEQGYLALMVEAPPARAAEIGRILEERLGDSGADAISAADRLAEFHRVENTYLSTFQTLGGLGLLLGTVGLAAVLLRNVLERRRELALLAAVGYTGSRLQVVVIAESLLMLVAGLAFGTLCALIAITPAASDRGGQLPSETGALVLLLAVFVVGLAASVVATRAVVRARLLDGLRAE
jgi:ABC-type lipoprotein release transport system permease subunit